MIMQNYFLASSPNMLFLKFQPMLVPYKAFFVVADSCVYYEDGSSQHNPEIGTGESGVSSTQ